MVRGTVSLYSRQVLIKNNHPIRFGWPPIPGGGTDVLLFYDLNEVLFLCVVYLYHVIRMVPHLRLAKP